MDDKSNETAIESLIRSELINCFSEYEMKRLKVIRSTKTNKMFIMFAIPGFIIAKYSVKEKRFIELRTSYAGKNYNFPIRGIYNIGANHS